MDHTLAGQILSRVEFQVRSSAFDLAVNTINSVNSELYPAFLFPTSREYNNQFAQNAAFLYTIELTENPNKEVQEASQLFLKRWTYIISSISPIDFLTNLQGTFQRSPMLSKFITVFLPALGNAISLMSDDEVLHNFPLIQRLFHFVPKNKQSEIPKSLWQTIGKFSPEDEIIQVLQKNLDIKFASISPNLIQKNPKKFTGILFKEALSAYLNEFLKNCPQKYRIDIDEAINRVNKDCGYLGSAGFNSTCQMLGNLIHYNTYDFSENQKTGIKNILDKLYSFLSDDHCVANDTNSILITLIEGVKKNLFEKDKLKKLMSQIQYKEECPQLKITLLKLYILFMEKDGDNSLAYKALLETTPWDDQLYTQYLEVIGENFTFLKELNPKIATKILWTIFHPLPIETNAAISIVKFLLKMNPTDVLNFQVESNLDYLIDKYFGLNNKELSKLTLQLAKLYKYSPPLTKIDLFNDCNSNYITLVQNADPDLVKELLTSGIISPQNRQSLLTVMKNQPDKYADFIVPLVNVLYMFCRVVGITKDVDNCFSRCGLQKPEFTEEIITFDEMTELFRSIDGPIDQSCFVTFLAKTLDTFSALASDQSNRSQVNQNVFAKAAVLASNLTLLCPKNVLNFVSSLHKLRPSDKKKKKKLFKSKKSEETEKETNSAVAGYNEAFRIVESSTISTKYSVDFVLYANSHIDSYEEMVKQFPKYINESLSKSRMITDMFKKELKQPLQPLQTFLSFVGMKQHEEWVNVCAQVIPPHEWMIRAGDMKIINGLKCVSEETKRILQLRFALIKGMPKPASEPKESYVYRSSYIRLKNLKIKSGPVVHPKDNKAVKPGIIEIKQIPLKSTASNEYFTNEEEEQQEEININNEEEQQNKGALYELISFLWHSNLDLPESIKPEDLENLAISHQRNPKMLIGFFSWANKHNYKIDLQKWNDKFYIKNYSSIWLLAISLFVSNIHCPFNQIPSNILNVIQKTVTAFGFPMINKQSLVYGYYHLSGLKWLMIRNIISIDTSFFNEYPLIVADITKNMDIFKKYFDEVNTDDDDKINFETFVGINDIIFNPPEDQMIQTSLIPTNRSFHSQLLTFKDISQVPSQLEIPKEILHSIANALQKTKNVSLNYLNFFMNIKLTEDQFERVKDIFFKEKEQSILIQKYVLPSFYLAEAKKVQLLEEQATEFYSEMVPPSMTRILFRSFLSNHSPTIENQSLVDRIERQMEKVFPELCYEGFSKKGIQTWPDALPISKLRFHYIDRSIGESLLNDMKIPCFESICIYRLLTSLSDAELAILINSQTSNKFYSYKAEISKMLLETASCESSSSMFALQAASIVCETIELKNAMILIANKDFIVRPNYLCVLIAFEYLRLTAQKDNNQMVLDFIQIFSNPESNLIPNDRKKIFFSLNTDDSLSSLIHPSY